MPPAAGVALRMKRSVAGSAEGFGLGGGGVSDDGIGDDSCVSGDGCVGGSGNLEGVVEEVCQASTGGSEVVDSASDGGSSLEFTGSPE